MEKLKLQIARFDFYCTGLNRTGYTQDNARTKLLGLRLQN